MSGDRFRSVLYLNQQCPFCLKLMIFLTEAGLLKQFEIRKFIRGDAAEQEIRAELAPHFEKVSFPAAQIAPGQYMKDTDALIAHYAKEAGVDPSEMALLNYYVGGVFERMGALFRENMEFKKQLAA